MIEKYIEGIERELSSSNKSAARNSLSLREQVNNASFHRELMNELINKGDKLQYDIITADEGTFKSAVDLFRSEISSALSGFREDKEMKMVLCVSSA